MNILTIIKLVGIKSTKIYVFLGLHQNLKYNCLSKEKTEKIRKIKKLKTSEKLFGVKFTK